jgi:CRISPR-associated protein Cas2
MLILVTYDVRTDTAAGRKRLRRVARLCENYGQRVQNSVFECVLDASQWVTVRKQVVGEIDPEEDSLRFYFLGSNWLRRVEHVGAKASYNPEGPLIL